MSPAFDVASTFSHEYAEEMRRRLRKWLLIYLAVQFGLVGIGLFVATVVMLLSVSRKGMTINFDWWELLQALIYAITFIWLIRRPRARHTWMLKIAFWVVLTECLLVVASMIGYQVIKVGPSGHPGSTETLLWATTGLIIVHAIACGMLPWKPMQSLKPILPALVLEVLLVAVFAGMSWGLVVAVVLTPLPGLAISADRTRRFNLKFGHRMLIKSWHDTEAEMAQATAIIDALLPDPICRSDVAVSWSHRPANAIGGDLVWMHGGEYADEPLTIVVLDVTGHGIPAALAVSRLHGDLTMLKLERPDAGPAELLKTLNRTAYLLLRQHKVFATAVAMEIDPASGRTVIASAGHPPLIRIEPSGETTVIGTDYHHVGRHVSGRV